MKLAEALAERAECQRKIEKLKGRLATSSKVQQGDEPAEDPAALLVELDAVLKRLLELIQQINKTNSLTAFDAARTLSDAIAERDIIAKKRDILVHVADSASTRQDRYSKSEVKFVATVAIGALQKQVDELARRYRELDTRIQELNWKSDVV